MFRHRSFVLALTALAALAAYAVLTTAAFSRSPTAAATPTAPAAPAVAAAFCSGVDVADLSKPYVFRYGLSGSELQTAFFDQDGLNGQGYRPRRLTAYRSGGAQQFATKWVKATGPEWYGRYGLTGDAFHALYLERRSAWRPTDVSGYNTTSGATRYAVVWERNATGLDWRVHRDVSRDGMQDLVDQYATTGFVPLRVEGYTLSGQLRYISIWVKTPCSWRMHNKMTRDEYQAHLDDYAGTYRLVHLDSFVDGGDVWYAGIWWQQPGPSQAVRSNRDWYLFQRFINNYDCQGAVIDNFVVTDVPGAVRYGGIWTFIGTPPAGPTSSLSARVQRELHCAPGRAGAAVINLTNGQEVLHHADQSFGTSSTIKSAILYAFLRRLDATPETLNTQLNVGAQYGSNQGNTLTANQSFTLNVLATTMIQNSNNWATNRLIDFVGRAQINEELDNLGLDDIRLERYMTGTGSPSAHGNSGPGGDYADGWDNTATPRQFATFLRRVHQNGGLLSAGSWTAFWNFLALNGNAHDAVLDAGVGTNWPTVATLAEKAGSNTWSSAPDTKPQIAASHLQRSAAGRLVFANGQVVFYAEFVDEADAPSTTPLQNMLDCVVMHAVRAYGGQTQPGDVAACQAS